MQKYKITDNYQTGNKISDFTPITKVGLFILAIPRTKSDFSVSDFILLKNYEKYIKN